MKFSCASLFIIVGLCQLGQVWAQFPEETGNCAAKTDANAVSWDGSGDSSSICPAGAPADVCGSSSSSVTVTCKEGYKSDGADDYDLTCAADATEYASSTSAFCVQVAAAGGGNCAAKTDANAVEGTCPAGATANVCDSSTSSVTVTCKEGYKSDGAAGYDLTCAADATEYASSTSAFCVQVAAAGGGNCAAKTDANAVEGTCPAGATANVCDP